MAHNTSFNGISLTYSAADLTTAKAASRCTPSSVYFINKGQVGKKTCGYTLMKEAHQTPDDIRRAKAWLANRSNVSTDILTAKPETI